MKCPNCGAEYSVTEVKCPFCGTANPEGIRLAGEQRQAEEDYKTAGYAAENIKKAMVNKVLNRILVTETIIIIAIFAAVIILLKFENVYSEIRSKNNQNIQNIEYMEKLYNEERFGELHVFMDEKGIFGEQNYEYSQIVLVEYRYQSFTKARMDYYLCKGNFGEGYIRAQILVDYMNDVMGLMMSSQYKEITERNQKIIDKYREDVEVFARNVLKFNDEEMDILRKNYMHLDESDALVKHVVEGYSVNE